MDSIEDFESLDLGSTPGTPAITINGTCVMDSIVGCGPTDLGSIPSVSTN